MFHWICPECGREIPPAVKECPACDPSAQVVAPVELAAPPPPVEPAPTPVVEPPVPPVAAAAVEPPAAIELPRYILPSVEHLKIDPAEALPTLELPIAVERQQPAAVAPPPPELEAVQAEPVAAEPEPVEAASLPVEPEPVAATPAAVEPEPVNAEPVAVEPEPVAAAPAPVEPEPVNAEPVAVEPEPVAAAPAPVESEPVQAEPVAVEPEPVAAAPAPVEPEPVQAEPAAVEPEPVAAAPAPVEPEPVQAEPAAVEPEPVAAAPAPVEPEPVHAEPVAVEPEPVAAAPAPVEPEPVQAEPVAATPAPAEPPQLAAPEPEPDPLLVLAESIRSAQRGDLPVTTPEIPGLPQLAAAVGLSGTPLAEPASSPVSTEPVGAYPAEPVASSGPAIEAVAAPQAVALLAPPAEPEKVEPQPVEPEPQASAPPQIEVLPPLPALKPAPAQNDLAGDVQNDAPPSGSWLQLAPLQNYSSAASRAIQPVAPKGQILSPDSGPRMTLPGPALPPDLERLQDANPVTVLGEPHRAPRRGMPGWLVSLMLMLGIPVAGAAVLLYFQPISHPSASAKAAPVEEATAAAPAPAASQSVSQFVEVTGFRIVVDFNKKSEIHYLVVNHSAADLSDMTIYVTLRAANSKPGQPPLCRFSFRAPSLGPFESKEMTSPIEKLTRSVTLPDWQDLKPEVQIAQ